jgi:hypothetical protein
MEWQPIETAPKDGTEVILWPGIRNQVNGVTPSAAGRWLVERSTMKGMWYDLGVGHHNGYWKPTHWMHLPAPPKEKPSE